MSKLITDPNRASRLMGVLCNNVDLGQVPDATVEWALQHPVEAGQQFTAFLKNGAKVIIGSPKIIPIDHSISFDTAFIGDRWNIDEQDERSLALTELDLTKICFETILKEGETVITGEEKLKRLKKAGHIRLDAKIFHTLWENKHLIPESWKEKTNGNTTFIYFDGTILRNPRGRRYVLYLYWHDGEWNWYYDWLGNGWDADSPSAVLAS